MSLLHLLWLASPALPVGAFSYSEGLEAAVDDGLVHDEASAREWLVNQLALVMARSELPVMAAAHAAALALDAARLQTLNDWVRQTRESAEPLAQTMQMGKSLLLWIESLQAGPGHVAWGAQLVGTDAVTLPGAAADGSAAADAAAALDTATPPCPTLPLLRALQPAPTWPVVLGCAAAWRGAAVRESLLAAAFGWAENMMQAAVRGVPLGQSAGQRLLARLVQAIPAAVDDALAAPEPIAFAPALAIACARHEAQYSRLFRS